MQGNMDYGWLHKIMCDESNFMLLTISDSALVVKRLQAFA